MHRQGGYDIAALDQLILQSFANWDKPTKQLLQGIEVLLNQHIGKAVEKALGKWMRTPLSDLVWTTSRKFLEQCGTEHGLIADQYLRYETEARPFTMNDELWKREEQAFMELIQRQRYRIRATKVVQAELPVGHDNSEVDQKIVSDKKRIGEILAQNQDPRAEELAAFAKIRASYNVASMRYVDFVCRSLEVEVLKKIHDELREHIENARDANEAVSKQTRCENLLDEDQERSRKRGQLEEDMANLTEAKRIIDEIRRKYPFPTENGTVPAEEDVEMEAF